MSCLNSWIHTTPSLTKCQLHFKSVQINVDCTKSSCTEFHSVVTIFTVTLGWLNTVSEEEESLEIVYFHDKMYHLAITITCP